MSAATIERIRTAVAAAGLDTVNVRRDASRLDAESALREAAMLRKRGLTWKEIAPHVGASSSWLGLYAPPELRFVPRNELTDRQAALTWAKAKAAYESLGSRVALKRTREIEAEWGQLERRVTRARERVARREAREREKERIRDTRVRERAALREAREREKERIRDTRVRERAAAIALEAHRAIEARAMRALRSDWDRAIAQARYRQRKAAQAMQREERERERVARREARTQERARERIRRIQRGWKSPNSNTPQIIRLDRVFEFDDESRPSQYDRCSALTDPYEPQRWLEAQLLDSLVGDLSIADIQGMSDEQLRPLRAKLIEAGFAQGGNVQRSERERLRMPMPRRGEGGGRKTFEAMTTDYKHRKPGHRASAGGVHNGRKPRRPGRGRQREKVVY